MTFKYGIDHLDLDIINGIANGTIQAELCQEALDKIITSRQRVEKMAASDKAVYGINTGFGPLCDTQITPEETNLLQKNLLITHAVGVGEPIAKAISKLMLITKVHALSKGFSGIRLATVERMLTFLELDLIPVVPEQGSVGASGDLAPLSHLFLPLLGEGEFWQSVEGQDDKIVPAAQALKAHGLAPMDLHAKEGLALINGTQFILSHAITGLTKMRYLLDLADLTGAMSIEGMQGSQSPFRAELHATRPFKGSLDVAGRMRAFFKGSQNMSSHTNCDRVQDPYSLRCIPQVHGASRNAFNHLKELAETEMNSVTDNPIVISEEEAISGGGFHGQPLAMVLDYASIAAAELGNIADRLVTFVGPTLTTQPGVFIESIASTDQNNVSFTEATVGGVNVGSGTTYVGGSGLKYPLTVTVRIDFNDNLQADADAVFYMYYSDGTGSGYGAQDFSATQATQVKKSDGNDVGSDVSNAISAAQSYQFQYGYEEDATAGRTPGTDVSVTTVAIGLSSGQYVKSTATITNTGATISLVAPLERNYSNA